MSSLYVFFFFSPHYFTQGPEGCVNKPFLWTEGRVSLKASLNKSAYRHGEPISVTVDIRNNSRKLIRKMRVSSFGFPIDRERIP